MEFGNIEHVILMGNGLLTANCAGQLEADGYDVLLAISPRHSQEIVTRDGDSLIEHLQKKNLKFVVSDDINADDRVTGIISNTTLGLSLGSAWIFRQEFIDLFGGNLLNMHGARLPQERGGGFSWQILRENHLGCCLIHQVDKGIDTGPIVKYKEYSFPMKCRIPQDYMDVAESEDFEFLLEFFREIKAKQTFKNIEQLEYLSTYWPRLSSEHHGYIDWDWDIWQIERFICAFDDPYKGASTFANGHRVFLKDCFLHLSDGTHHPFQSGIIYRKSPTRLFVAGNGGSIVLGTVTTQDEASIFKNIRVGDRFHTPIDLLQKAKNFRAIYTPTGLLE